MQIFLKDLLKQGELDSFIVWMSSIISIGVASKLREHDSKVPQFRQLRSASQYNIPRATLQSLESELLKALKWNLLRTTAFDFAQMLKVNGFLFSDDTIGGIPIISNWETIVLKANLLLDTLIKEISMSCEYSEFYSSEIAASCVLSVRTALGLDRPYSESLRELLCCHS